GTHALHGVAEPMTLSRVRGLLAPPSPDEEFVTATVPVLVGREEESGLLRRRWEQSKAGLGQVVFISGEAGIGKSALVERLRAQGRAEGLPRIAYRCSPYHTTSALYPVITHIEHLLQFVPDDPPATKLAKLEAGLRPYDLPAERYWQRAGQQASERSANLEAISHFTTGIELLKTLPETPQRTQQALTLHIALGAALQMAKGHAAPEVEHAYTQAHALCQQVSETPQLVPVLFGLWRYNIQRSAKKLMRHSASSGYDRRQIHPRGGGDDHGIPLA